MAALSRLFSPTRMGELELANRIVMAPMTRNRADAQGVPGAFPPLAGNKNILGDPNRGLDTVLLVPVGVAAVRPSYSGRANGAADAGAARAVGHGGNSLELGIGVGTGAGRDARGERDTGARRPPVVIAAARCA